jgi:hypothetical protein
MAADGEQQQSRVRCTWETALLLCIIDKLLDVQIHHGRQQKRISAWRLYETRNRFPINSFIHTHRGRSRWSIIVVLNRLDCCIIYLVVFFFFSFLRDIIIILYAMQSLCLYNKTDAGVYRCCCCRPGFSPLFYYIHHERAWLLLCMDGWWLHVSRR